MNTINTAEQDMYSFFSDRDTIKSSYINCSNVGSFNIFYKIQQYVRILKEDNDIEPAIAFSSLNKERSNLISNLILSHNNFSQVFNEIYKVSDFISHLSQSGFSYIIEADQHPKTDIFNSRRDSLDTLPLYDLQQDDCFLLKIDDWFVALNSSGMSFISQDKDMSITICQDIVTIFIEDLRFTYCNVQVKHGLFQLDGIAVYSANSTDGNLSLLIHLSNESKFGMLNNPLDIDGIQVSTIYLCNDSVFVSSYCEEAISNMTNTGNPVMMIMFMHKVISFDKYHFIESTKSEIDCILR